MTAIVILLPLALLGGAAIVSARRSARRAAAAEDCSIEAMERAVAKMRHVLEEMENSDV